MGISMSAGRNFNDRSHRRRPAANAQLLRWFAPIAAFRNGLTPLLCSGEEHWSPVEAAIGESVAHTDPRRAGVALLKEAMCAFESQGVTGALETYEPYTYAARRGASASYLSSLIVRLVGVNQSDENNRLSGPSMPRY